MKPYRHELKYYISQIEYELLSRKLSLTMNRDKFALKDGKYFIRSLYFDNLDNDAISEKLDGEDKRDKYRLRIYNLKDDVIKLEQKHKQGSFIQKNSLSITRAECDALIEGDYTPLLRRNEQLAKQFYAIFRLQNLKPCVIVDYWREAYVFPVEDVRITFDLDVRTAYRATGIFDPELPTYPATEQGYTVLEIKFNRYLPGYIRALIQPIENAQRSAISKYCLSRKYE
ncbi:polyphosphate polymerase domain-containing protein [Eubacteriales bacterium OttesenSCG-928-K08]|nr:polyphosphate polymerase domain-containing protein [Eubacteriales bacterium OttesenSCG-928-K08]